MRLTVNLRTCLRSGQCTYMHPRLFREGEDGFPVVLVEHPEGELLEEARDAAELCPSSSIHLLDDDAAAAT